MKRIMNTALSQALKYADEIENFPLGKCSPSDDPDMQTAYLYAFRDLAKRFVASAKRIGDAQLSEMINNLDTSPDFITDAYDLRAELYGVIDYLKEASEIPNYPKNVENNSAVINSEVHIKRKADRMITYEDFINELRKLVASGEKLYGVVERDLDPHFRQWRLEVTDLLSRINQAGYSVRCYIRNRSFGTHRNATEEYLNDEYRIELQDTLNELSLLIKRYETYGEPSNKTLSGGKTQGLGKIFLGHGRNPLWNRVLRFLKDELSMEVIAFETESRTSSHIVDVLTGFLDDCNFAVIVMTAEDETTEGKTRSRQNVIHEIGLFQGRHGFNRVLIFQQEGVEEFSNIAGLQTIRFKEKPEDGFYELQRALKRHIVG